MSRAIASAFWASSRRSVMPATASIRARSASARAYNPGSAPAGCASWSARAAANQASPSCRRPRARHNGCRHDANSNAWPVSPFSRLNAKAARRLSISSSAWLSRRSWPATEGASSPAATAA
ncbi:Uncharacterised protein [Mycobacterium tuberculosis]|nr:Uncharacterised protein [Mycobacterium tuberculosis]